MKVENPYLRAAAPSTYEKAAGKKDVEAAADTGPVRLKSVEDQVVISFKARSALHEMRSMPEVDLTLKALMSSAPLTEERAGQVLERIQRGFYKQPEVLQKIAALLSNALKREP